MRYSCIINFPWVSPVREAESEEEFITNFIEEYNETYAQCCEGPDIDRSMIVDVKSEEQA
jgi:translation initiation factor 2 beta subunit (eIF-2beta)/eIF-5